MSSLVDNAKIFTKINVPKYMFTLSKNVSALVNFGLTLIVFFVFCIMDDIHFWPGMFLLVYPIACLLIFNIGVGMILSALFVFFRDVRYLYDVFLTLITYMSAIFYSVDKYWFKNSSFCSGCGSIRNIITSSCIICKSGSAAEDSLRAFRTGRRCGYRTDFGCNFSRGFICL